MFLALSNLKYMGHQRVKSFLFVALIGILASGCATYSQTGIRTVEHEPVRVGPVSKKLNFYHAPKGVSFPTKNSTKLVLKCEKEIDLNVKYITPTHEEEILMRSVSEIQESAEDIFEHIKKGLKKGRLNYVIEGILEIPILLLISPSLLLEKPTEETKYVKVSNSESAKFYYVYETQSVPAPGIKLELQGFGSAVTNSQGIVAFHNVKPYIFTNGVKIIHHGAQKKFIITSKKYTKKEKYIAPWRDAAQLGNTMIGACTTIKKIKNIAAFGGGPCAIGGAVLFDLATGLIVGSIIDVFAIDVKENEFYRWSILPE